MFVAYYQRFLKQKDLLACVGEKRSFHTSESCITNFSKTLTEWSSITKPTSMKCVGLKNKEIENVVLLAPHRFPILDEFVGCYVIVNFNSYNLDEMLPTYKLILNLSNG